MKKRNQQKKTKHLLNQTTHANAAGIDIGSEELYVAIPAERSDDPVRMFHSFTSDVYNLRDWLLEHNIDTVAMESTGNYWIACYQILEDAGIEVCLVNARHVKAVPGRKTDVCDAQWLQQLHQSGLLKGSFRPEKDVIPLRYLMRHRNSLIRSASQDLQHMQKVLTEMNIKLHHVFSDLDGVSAMQIIEAIIEGQRDVDFLWNLRDRRCRSSKQDFEEAMNGDWRDEYLFVLKQCLESWKKTQDQITDCDSEIEKLMSALKGHEAGDAGGGKNLPDQQTKPRKKSAKNDLRFDVFEQGQRIYGVDLTSIDRVGAGTLAILISELGTREQILKDFKSGSAFASWLGLCPDNRISGGKILKSKTRKVVNAVSRALRLSAFGLAFVLANGHSELGQYTRRIKGRLGKAEGITATAHKLARIIYAMISSGKEYDEADAFKKSPKTKQRQLKNLKKRAQALGFKIVDAESVTA